MITRHFTFISANGSSRKFWRITFPEITRKPPANPMFVTEWGRIGTKGQSKEFPCASLQEALLRVGKLIDSKLRKGYRESSAASVSSNGVNHATVASKKMNAKAGKKFAKPSRKFKL